MFEVELGGIDSRAENQCLCCPRLRAKGGSHETREVLLGHKNGQITTHYSAAELGELIEAVEKVSWSGSSAPTLTLIKNANFRKSPPIGRWGES